MRIIEILFQEQDDNTIKIIQVKIEKGVFALDGKCKRCGKCCKSQNCEELYFENVNGVPICICKLQFSKFGKPYCCKIYPKDPQDPLMQNCGFSWRKISA